MRLLDPVYNGTSYPKCWKCSRCQKKFWRPPDLIDQTSLVPPVAVWVAFENHRCALQEDVIAENR